MSAPSLDAPRSKRQITKNNFELNAWLFMRVSGVVLIILVLGHLLIMNILDGGVHRINFAFVLKHFFAKTMDCFHDGFFMRVLYSDDGGDVVPCV